MKCKNNFKFTTTYFLFLVSYMLFVFSLFNRDVSDTGILYALTVPAKYISLIIVTCGILCRTYSIKKIQWIIILLCIDIFVLFNSGVLIFILISLFAFFSAKIEDEEILKIAYYTLLIYTVIVILLCAFGIYNDVITHRWVGSEDRRSFGFYHSNVLPLIYSYLVGYGLASGIYQKKHYVFLILIDVLIFYFCGSRNALITTLLLIGGKWFSDSIRKKSYKNRIDLTMGFFAKFIIPILTVISIVVPLLIDQVKVFKLFDFILSYRFTYIANIIKNEGLHFITKMTNEMYFSNEIVIDNGYAFLTVRYGLLIVIFLSIITYCVAKKYKDNTFILILIIIVACSNLIDNDLMDYSCLPYLIISEKCVIEGIKRRGKSNG